MPIAVTCPECSAKMKAPDAVAGKKVKCPKCQTMITVPAAQAEFEVVEDEPAPAKKPVKAEVEADEDEQPKKKAKAVVAEDDDEEDEKPKKKRAQAEADEEEDEKPKKKAKAGADDEDDEDDEDQKPKKKKAAAEDDEDDGETTKKKKKKSDDDDDDEDEEKGTKKKKKKKKKSDDEGGGVSMARNIIGAVVLIILLGVAGAVYYFKFFADKDDKPSNTNTPNNPQQPNPPGPNPPGGPPGPGGKLPGPPGPGGKLPNPPGPGDPGPNPGGKEDPYTGVGFTVGTVVEEEVEVSQLYMENVLGEWFMFVVKRGPDDRPTMSGRVFLKPDQQSKLNSLWHEQKIKIRGRKFAAVAGDIYDFYGTEILSTGAAPKSVEMTADQLLKEFRDNPADARKRWTKSFTDPDAKDPPWIKLTGIYDGASPNEIDFPGIQLKGDGADGAKPNRIIIDTPLVWEPITKKLKKGDRITVRVRNLVPENASAGQIRFSGSLLPIRK